MKLRSRWNEFWFAPEAAQNLGLCRILFFGAMLLFFYRRQFSGWAEFGPSSAFWQPIWLFHSMHVPLFSAPVLSAFTLIWKISFVLGCIGLFTRTSALVAMVLSTYLIGLTYNYGKIEASTMPLIFAMAALALSRCGDAFSIDAWLRRRRGISLAAPSGEYRWPVRIVWLVMSIGFCAAAFAKLRYSGIRWATGDALSILLTRCYFDPHPPMTKLGLFVANHSWMTHGMGVSSLLTELLFPLALFDRRARRILPLAALGMQAGIGISMNIWFTHYLAVYLFWVPWDRVLKVIAPTPAMLKPSPIVLEFPEPTGAADPLMGIMPGRWANAPRKMEASADTRVALIHEGKAEN